MTNLRWQPCMLQVLEHLRHYHPWFTNLIGSHCGQPELVQRWLNKRGHEKIRMHSLLTAAMKVTVDAQRRVELRSPGDSFEAL